MRNAWIAAAWLFAIGAGTPALLPHGNLVVSAESPALTLRVDPHFRALKPLNFPIEDLTNAERRIFVEAGRDRVVDRMVVIQFEKVRPGSAFRFHYPSTPPRRFGDETYRFGTFAYDDAAAARARPDKEPGRTRAFLAPQFRVERELDRRHQEIYGLCSRPGSLRLVRSCLT